MSLVLPWEVIETIIEYASKNLNSLRSFSLTCRQLRPRSTIFIFAHYIFLSSRARVSAFCDFLQENIELRPLIKSITVSPADFRPLLFTMLPQLATFTFRSCGYKEYHHPSKRAVVKLHKAALDGYHSLGKGIRTLYLDHLSFQTPCDFFRLLLVFPKTTQVTCKNIDIKSPAENQPAMDVVRRKLKQRRLEVLNVRTIL